MKVRLQHAAERKALERERGEAETELERERGEAETELVRAREAHAASMPGATRP